MIKIEGEFGERIIAIYGGRIDIGDIENIIGKIEEIDRSNETISQLFDASKIAGRDHLTQSAILALESLERNRSFADTPSIELTCWTAGLRQINKSLDIVGIKDEKEKVAGVTIGKSSSDVENSLHEIIKEVNIERDDEVIEVTDDKIEDICRAFSINSDQLEVSSITDLVLEEISLLSLEQ